MESSKEEPILIKPVVTKKKEASKEEPLLVKAAKKVVGKAPTEAKVPDTQMVQVTDVKKTEGESVN